MSIAVLNGDPGPSGPGEEAHGRKMSGHQALHQGQRKALPPRRGGMDEQHREP